MWPIFGTRKLVYWLINTGEHCLDNDNSGAANTVHQSARPINKFPSKLVWEWEYHKAAISIVNNENKFYYIYKCSQEYPVHFLHNAEPSQYMKQRMASQTFKLQMPEVKQSVAKGCGSEPTHQKSVTQKIALFGCGSGWFWKLVEPLEKISTTKKNILRQLEFSIFDYCRSSSSHNTLWMVPFKSTHWCDQNCV